MWVRTTMQTPSHSSKLIIRSTGYAAVLSSLFVSALFLLAADLLWQRPADTTVSAWLQQRWYDTIAFEGFHTYTINRLYGGPRETALPVGLIAALWVGIAALLWLGWRGLRRRPITLAPLGLMILVGWLVLDLRWQWDLWQQLDLTRQQFAGHSAEQKRLREQPRFAALTYQLAVAALERTADDPDQRYFIVSPNRYWRYRVAYFLYPRNVAVALVGSEALRPGDYMVLFQEPRLQYRQIAANRVQLLLDRQPYVTARPVLLSQAGNVFQVVE